MSISLQEAIKVNEIAIEALEKSIDDLKQLRKGKPLAEQKRFTSKISRARAEITEIEVINEHLRAAIVVIAPMNPAVEERLRVLADRLDAAIKRDATLTATLETVLDVIAAAEEVSAIIDDHS